MTKRKQVLFLQLPQLDNDLHGKTENVPLAAAYLRYAAEQAGEGRHYAFLQLPESALMTDNAALLETLVRLNPAVVACTLYLWNIERTLRLMQRLRARRPGVKILLGGPEVATTHPFLFQQTAATAIVVGEGEIVFPALLRSFRTGRPVNLSTVALKTSRGYRWGTRAPEPVTLSQHLPPPGYAVCRPNADGMAYLETSRGCPMRCTYCRYPHLRRSMSFLEPGDILARVRALRRLGATEIRFVDPSFNSHPRFRDILRQLATLNRSRRLTFFAEVNAERLTDEEADNLAKAGFAEIEVGMQSRDASVLKAIRRPTALARLDEGIRRLTRRRIKITLDVMYGLPLQTLGDVRRSTSWALRLPRTNVQCLQTLLLPGTELRERQAEWSLVSQARPPYAVTRTSTMDAEAFRTVETLISRHPKLSSDVPTSRFAGKNLELFPAPITVPMSLSNKATDAGDGALAKRLHLAFQQPTSIRQAYRFTGPDLFGRRAAIGRFMTAVMKREPDGLFQFVLCPSYEEPLDLLEALTTIIREQPSHLIDRYASVALEKKVASRRLMVELPAGKRFAREWIEEAEDLLSSSYF